MSHQSFFIHSGLSPSAQFCESAKTEKTKNIEPTYSEFRKHLSPRKDITLHLVLPVCVFRCVTLAGCSFFKILCWWLQPEFHYNVMNNTEPLTGSASHGNNQSPSGSSTAMVHQHLNQRCRHSSSSSSWRRTVGARLHHNKVFRADQTELQIYYSECLSVSED